jgi:uncharacterized protein YigA (DUF484 family)
MQDNEEQLSEHQITSYLREHPKFFEQHPSLLAEMYLPSPHGNGAISLAERQQLAQRDRIRIVEAKLAELLKFGEENDAISDKVHRLCLGLLAAQSFDILLQLLTHTLREDFQVPHVTMRIWCNPRNIADGANEIFQPVDAELQSWAQNLAVPYCGHEPGIELNSWFGESVAPKSFALIALRSEKVIGLLALASEDERRFYPEMGTLYLKRIGELVSAALLRYTV